MQLNRCTGFSASTLNTNIIIIIIIINNNILKNNNNNHQALMDFLVSPGRETSNLTIVELIRIYCCLMENGHIISIHYFQ